MGIIFSLIFPGQFMSSQYSPSSTSADDSRPSSPDPDPVPVSPLSPPDDDLPDWSPPSSPKHSVIASPPLDSQPYSPHVLGIGILSPQPVLGRFAPISRASLSPLQVRTSPVEQRSNPLESLSPRDRGSVNPFDLHALRPTAARSPESTHVSPPPPHSLWYVGDNATKDGSAGEHASLPNFSSASPAPAGLHISIPPRNPSASTSTPSPPLLPPPAHDPVASAAAAIPDQGGSGTLSDPQTMPVDSIAPPTDINIDFTEFDAEGYSALEKIYLFSRSRAGFHRVFIAHALPRYLLGAENATNELPSREQIEQITPSEAVDYVLPLLNILATDDDEAVKEALAAELVPIIWWFVTHCRLVEDDTAPQLASPPASTPPLSNASLGPEHESFLLRPPTPRPKELLAESAPFTDAEFPADQNEDEQTLISVQAFTPLLGTLLLSPNGIVGGSARYAVVELLRRLRRADQREDEERASLSASLDDLLTNSHDTMRASSPTPSQAAEEQDANESADVGLFQRGERRLFEHELVYQVVIGMGRLDMEDGRADQQEEVYEAALGSGVSTAVPTPQAEPTTTTTDSYFPETSLLGLPAGQAASTSAPPPLPPPAESTPINIAAPPPPASSPSPPASSASSISDSPGRSCSSTPSLTSSASSSCGSYTDNIDLPVPDGLSIGIGIGDANDATPKTEEPPVPTAVDEATGADADADASVPIPEDWPAPSPPARHAALPTTPPFDVPPPAPALVAAPVPISAEALPATGLPLLQVQAPSESPVAEAEAPMRQVAGWLSPGTAARELAAIEEQQQQDDGGDLNEEAAVGRLSSMSLMAAVTASGSISEDTKSAFVAEVERVGRDSIYWVRREASFAVGALAKVVPVEVVTSSLLPLFESLCQDPTWHVRHSVLFALPAILSRLPPEHRRRLALDVVLPLSQDEEPTVRSAVLEALGEVMHTFADDADGPPAELLQLFLGIRETEDPGGGDLRPAARERAPAPEAASIPQPPSATSTSTMSSAWSDYGTDGGGAPDIYDDPQRPLVCAFNYPAVALTLGRARWPELRELYHTLAQSPAFKIRRTLAASLGEMAKIVGEEHARADLMGVWRSSLRSEETDVRMKVLDAIQTFVRAIGVQERAEVVGDLDEALASGKLSSWRERERAVKTLGGLVEVEGVDGEVLRRMLVRALDDRVAAVREAAVAAIPAYVREWKDRPALLEALREDVRAFASSDSFRRRTTYVTCMHELLVLDQGDVVVRSETFWSTLSQLCRDPIVDVRIRVARLLGLISDKFSRDDGGAAANAAGLAQSLTLDGSHEVRAFASAVVAGASTTASASSQALPTIPVRIGKSAATFSRPPPPSPNS
ncbi:hypothetical protein C8Q78DRAFT_970689 [Trametes maxima]|nr:hypothetical protein C8Q78DRAFT_970689 [Trametes maxima]